MIKWRFSLIIIIIVFIVGVAFFYYFYWHYAPSRLSFPSTKSFQLENLLKFAQQEEERGNLIDAQKLLLKALEIDPQNKEVKKALGRVEKAIKKIYKPPLAKKKATPTSPFPKGIPPLTTGLPGTTLAIPTTAPLTPSAGGSSPSTLVDLTSYVPEVIPGYERTSLTSREGGVFASFIPLVEGEVYNALISIWQHQSSAAAEKFITNVSKVLFPDDSDDFTYKGYKAYFGTNRERDEATYVWVAGSLTFELHATGRLGKPVNLRDDLENIAKWVPL